MYRYLDRSLDQLDSFERLILHAIRLWAQARPAGPNGAVGRLFADHGVGDAGADFHDFMAVTEEEMLGDLTLARPCCGTLTDDEALLLTLWDHARNGSQLRTWRAMQTILKPAVAVGMAARACRTAASVRMALLG